MGKLAAGHDTKALGSDAVNLHQTRLWRLKMGDAGQRTYRMEGLSLDTRAAYFGSLQQGDDAERGSVLAALLHHVEVAHFKNTQRHQATREKHRSQGE